MKKLLLTGSEESNQRLRSLLGTELEVVNCPLQEFELLAENEQSLAPSYDLIIFTSRTAVKFYYESIHTAPTATKIAAVGLATKSALESYGQSVDFVPKQNFSAAGLMELLSEKLTGDESALFPCSKLAAHELEDVLSTKLKSFQRFELYQPIVKQNLTLPEFDELVFLSPSAVEVFLDKFTTSRLAGKKIYSIGDSTSQALIRHGLIYSQAEQSSLESLAQLISGN